MKKSIYLYLKWRLAILLFVVLSVKLLPLQNNYLGGGMSNYLSDPLFWWHSNFDGEHYLSIARYGYKSLQYFFFPIFPLIIRYSSILFGYHLSIFQLSGLVISAIFSLLALVYLIKLVKLDFKKTNLNVFLLTYLLFPTSFYLTAVYTESLFLFLAVFSFYQARKKNWVAAGLTAAVASATRVVGISLVAALAVEYILQNKLYKNINFIKYLNLMLLGLLMGFGLLAYLYFMYKQTGDPLIFIHEVEIFGNQRSSSLVLLPQVFYRYFLKILPSLNNYWPAVFSTFLELNTAVIFLGLIILGYFKLRLSYWTYLTLGYLIPTLSGSFSSLPRYVLVLFPGFILITKILQKQSRFVQIALAAISFACLGLATAMFARGYWIS